jgi:hypothetical protein
MLPKKDDRSRVPQYSLTGDLLSFLRCGLQYRYLSGSALPPSRPVQLWFGEFIHGVLESAFRLWTATQPAFPWPCNRTLLNQPSPQRVAWDIGELGDVVEKTLSNQGKNPRSYAARDSAYARATLAVNELGPHLFPLIASAEERILGTRALPPRQGGIPYPGNATLYELQGIADVVTHIQLSGATSQNIIKSEIHTACPQLTGQYQVIVDYKGARRPATTHAYWHQGDWQVQTYAWLRSLQPTSLPVAAGLLIYINELDPSSEDLRELKDELRNGHTDVTPLKGGLDEANLRRWTGRGSPPPLSTPFRIARALRVVPVSAASQAIALTRFDQTVSGIETCIIQENATGQIGTQWPACGDAATCVACDFRHFCPDPFPRGSRGVPTSPHAP